MWTMIAGWIRKHWFWILGVLVILILGAVAGWRLAVLLGIGGIAGGAGKALGETQRRAIEGQQLKQERQSLEDRAKETDAMIDDYYRKKRGG